MTDGHRQIAFDTETTGIEASEHRIIEIGAVELRNRRIVADRRWYLNPDRDSDPGALAVHGLTTAFLSDKPRFSQIADELIAFLAGAELVIHNAAFDVGFLDRELERAGRPERVASLCTVIDTVPLAKRLHPGQKVNLDALCRRYGVDNSNRELHGALIDARLLAEVYLAMTGGQSLLGLTDATATARTPADADAALCARSWTGRRGRVIPANAAELAAHEARIAAIAAKSGRQPWPEQSPAPTTQGTGAA